MTSARYKAKAGERSVVTAPRRELPLPPTDIFTSVTVITDEMVTWVTVPHHLARRTIAHFGLQRVEVYGYGRTGIRYIAIGWKTHPIHTGTKDWELFVLQMIEQHGIDVPNEMAPRRIVR